MTQQAPGITPGGRGSWFWWGLQRSASSMPDDYIEADVADIGYRLGATTPPRFVGGPS
ncbi:MAG: hypothetical protein ACXVP1_07810 [Thermoleophilia bacterium]